MEPRQTVSLADLLRRPEIGLDDLAVLSGTALAIAEAVKVEVELEVKYEGYIKRQMEQVARSKKLEEIELPPAWIMAALPVFPMRWLKSSTPSRPVPWARPHAFPG